MRKVLGSLAVLGAMALATPALAQDRVVIIDTDRDGPLAEVGIQAGYPTGISGKMWFDNVNALGVGLGFVPATDSTIVHLDYLAHSPSLAGEDLRLPLYAGLGLRAVNYDDNGLDMAVGPRVPVGVSAIFSELPISMFAEIAPTAEFDGDGNIVLTADAGVGARLWF